MSKTKPAKLRVDAARNRERLIEAARETFANSDLENVSLEAVAKAAGVGIGTLYRNFPTRDALAEAVYCAELDAVTAAANELLRKHPGIEALKLWMERYARFVATKQGMLDALRAAWASGALTKSDTRIRITATIAQLLDAGVVDGTIRSDVRADDLTTSLVGVFLATHGASDRQQARRILALLADSVRVRSPRS